VGPAQRTVHLRGALVVAQPVGARRITPGALTSWRLVQRALAIYSTDAPNPAALPGLIADLRAATECDLDYGYCTACSDRPLIHPH